MQQFAQIRAKSKNDLKFDIGRLCSQSFNYVIFTCKPKKQKSVHMSSQISLDSIALKQETEVKFLGVYIDEGLMWKSHISYICKKISFCHQMQKYRCIIP